MALTKGSEKWRWCKVSYICIFPKQASRQRLLWLQEGVCVDASLFVSYIAENDTVLDYTNILSPV